mgnify:CR=1 FL=1
MGREGIAGFVAKNRGSASTIAKKLGYGSGKLDDVHKMILDLKEKIGKDSGKEGDESKDSKKKGEVDKVVKDKLKDIVSKSPRETGNVSKLNRVTDKYYFAGSNKSLDEKVKIGSLETSLKFHLNTIFDSSNLKINYGPQVDADSAKKSLMISTDEISADDKKAYLQVKLVDATEGNMTIPIMIPVKLDNSKTIDLKESKLNDTRRLFNTLRKYKII